MSRNWNERQRANCLRTVNHIPQVVARGDLQGAKNLLESVRVRLKMEIIARDRRIQEAYRVACAAVANHKTPTAA
jgi:hypothetical protein